MKKTVIFGGTFDPFHIGHKKLLSNVMAEGFDRAIVIPAGTPPHKERQNAKGDFERRLLQTKKMVEGMPGVTVSDIEGRRQGKSFTVDTIETLKQMYPDDRFYLLMGSDMLLYIEKWYRFEDILKYVTLISAPRLASDRKKITEYKKYLESKYVCDIIIYDFDIVEISSTLLRSPLVRRIDAHNREHLSEKRYAHVRAVADYAVSLCAYHNIDSEKAYIAALAHDCTKYMDEAQQLSYLESSGIELSDEDRKSPKILHQISGAHFARYALGIEDGDILSAIGCHTTGKCNMSPLDMLICLADSIEPTRDYEGVEKMRDIAKSSLDKALLLCFDRLIEFIKQRGLYMHPETVKARDWLKGQING